MKAKEFADLKEKRTQVENEMKQFIIKALQENDGRISLNLSDDEKFDDNNYPVTTTLYGRHDYPNIRISSIYLLYEEIYADGVDSDTGEMRYQFYVHSEQYADIFDFVGHVLEMN